MEPALHSPAHLPARTPRIRIGRQEAALIVVTMFWGGTFLVVQNALSVSSPLMFVGLRFGSAALVLALVSWRSLDRITWLEAGAGGMVGAAIAIGYCLQTIGLQTILSSKSGFITALYVPIVPLMQWMIMRRAPSLPAWAGIVLAFAGLLLIAGPEGAAVDMSYGEFVTFVCAVAFAVEITLIGTFADRVDARRVAIVQLTVCSALAFATAFAIGEPFPAFSWLLCVSVAGIAVASAAIQLAMNWAQKTVSPTRATVIYASEPVWAGLFGRLAGEVLSPRALIGCAMIVIAVVVSQLRSNAETNSEK